MRTPLTIVQGYLELLSLMDNVDTETRRSFLNKARRACDELILIQTNIMDAGRVQFDLSSIHQSQLLLKDVCSATIDLFEPIIIWRKRQITVNIPGFHCSGQMRYA